MFISAPPDSPPTVRVYGASAGSMGLVMNRSRA